MRRAAKLLLLLIAYAGLMRSLGSSVPCAANLCECDMRMDFPTAFCTGKRLYSIHTGVPSDIQALDLSNNFIIKLENRELSKQGLIRLKFLNLSMNAIGEIGPRAFEYLKNLTVLDLSYNRIDYLSPDTFYYNKKLVTLNLAGNKFNLFIPKLHSSTITSLNMSSCQITCLYEDTFLGLTQLRKLDLSNNFLNNLTKDVLRAMPDLESISLQRNPWPCNRGTYEMELYLHQHGIHAEPLCPKPASIAAKFKNIIELKPIGESQSPIKKFLPITSITSSNNNDGKAPWHMTPWRHLMEEAIQEQEEQQSTGSGSSGIFTSALGNVSPFWFLLIGFLLGSGATMVVTYLWLSTTISCLIPRIRRAETTESADASSQRVSLLRHLWHQENLASSEDSNINSNGIGTATTALVPPNGSTPSPPSCPGTPPPPYREVMLHRNLYPRAAMTAAAQQRSTAPNYNII